jgi:hypothetical protein
VGLLKPFFDTQTQRTLPEKFIQIFFLGAENTILHMQFCRSFKMGSRQLKGWTHKYIFRLEERQQVTIYKVVAFSCHMCISPCPLAAVCGTLAALIPYHISGAGLYV